ncbi:MAG: hypothetical protein JNG82_04150 [Opitutaceae bacterium]|jgi:hypothetical protein|nr:hypothetical protein [Opitutaceae bacterium]
MDEPLQELENELKQLQPRRARARWLEQINRDLAAELPAPSRPRYATATNLGSWKWLGWRTTAVAAALALVATFGVVTLRRPVPAAIPAIPDSAAPAAGPAYEPVAASNVLYDLKDEGAVPGAGEAGARRVRARYVDTYTWKNPRNNASIKWTVPRDEIRVVPASYNPN